MSCAYLTWYTAQSIEGSNKATGKRKRFNLLSPGAEDSVSLAFGHQNFQPSIPKTCSPPLLGSLASGHRMN